MERMAEDLYLLDGLPRHGFNVYLAGDVLVDAATRFGAGRILRETKGKTLRAHALTHAHADHQGASHRICDEREIPLWCGAGDAEAMTNGDFGSLVPLGPVTRLQLRYWAGLPHPVARRLREGDEVGEFTVLETPGHTPGSICFWREADGVLLVGDVLFNRQPFSGKSTLREPPAQFTVDPSANRKSILRLAELEPKVVCFGHGQPLRDRGQLEALAERLKG